MRNSWYNRVSYSPISHLIHYNGYLLFILLLVGKNILLITYLVALFSLTSTILLSWEFRKDYSISIIKFGGSKVTDKKVQWFRYQLRSITTYIIILFFHWQVFHNFTDDSDEGFQILGVDWLIWTGYEISEIKRNENE